MSQKFVHVYLLSVLYSMQMQRIRCIRIQRIQDDLKRYDEELAKHQSAVNYFESLVPRITHSQDEPCVICLDTIDRLTVTPCGHLYCHKCIIHCLQQQGVCPTCRSSVTEQQLIEVKVNYPPLIIKLYIYLYVFVDDLYILFLVFSSGC